MSAIWIERYLGQVCERYAVSRNVYIGCLAKLEHTSVSGLVCVSVAEDDVPFRPRCAESKRDLRARLKSALLRLSQQWGAFNTLWHCGLPARPKM